MFATEIAAGAAALDQAAETGLVPSNWRGNLNLDTLSISSVFHCVTAQTFGDRFEKWEREHEDQAYGTPWSFGVDMLARAIEGEHYDPHAGESTGRHNWSSAHGFSVKDNHPMLSSDDGDLAYTEAEELLTEEWQHYLTTGSLSE